MPRLLRRLFTPTPPEAVPAAHAAYIALVAQARNVFFYESMGVPDTLDGRFELIVLHLFLLQQRLLAEPGAEAFSRRLSEAFFGDMDRSVRELGVADTGVRYRIKAMAKAYHGRLQAYTATSADRTQLLAALARNLFGTVAEGEVAMLEKAADYVQAMQQQLAATTSDAITRGGFVWPQPQSV